MPTNAYDVILMIIYGLGAGLLFTVSMCIYICIRLIAIINDTMKRIESSQTTQQQYMYMIRGDVNKINTELTAFFVVNGYKNAMEEERRLEIMRARGRAPPSAGSLDP